MQMLHDVSLLSLTDDEAVACEWTCHSRCHQSNTAGMQPVLTCHWYASHRHSACLVAIQPPSLPFTVPPIDLVLILSDVPQFSTTSTLFTKGQIAVALLIQPGLPIAGTGPSS